ncbi:hypothetical protein E4K68_06660 [Desulfosporosinus sp. Sb-LF]|nr:hypothetical protein E4K68_06660 [Desulfosporosinus sp. Sb-LF]
MDNGTRLIQIIHPLFESDLCRFHKGSTHCTQCGLCVGACPSFSLELPQNTKKPREITQEITIKSQTYIKSWQCLCQLFM